MLPSLAIVLLLATAGISSAAEPQLTGGVSGRVSVAGDIQPPSPLKVFKNRDFCGSAVPNETLMANREGGLRNTVVILRPLDRVTASQPGRLVLDNKGCAFVPHVQVASVGSELVLKNSDPILHTVHARIGQETLFNVGLPRWREVTKTLGRAGVIRIDCDVLHTWMSALIVVTSSPYYSITDENGYFAIEGVPTGAYDVEVWHEKLGTRSARISVSERAEVSLEVLYALRRNQL